MPDGLWASVLHVGPYEQCGPAYEALAAWIKEQGYEPLGTAYEAYCSEPDTPSQQIRTWIMYPLK